LKKQRLPESLVGARIWDRRLKAIRRHETHLAQQGTRVIKFFLNVGREEQKKRLIARIDDPTKNWKFEVNDLSERKLWDDYMVGYEQAIRATATKDSPWYVIPADDKNLMRVAVMAAIKREMKKLDLAFPALDAIAKAKLGDAKRLLLSEK
ncbi:MAG: polyphosphate kinase 2 family protein, partial [Beijerinckiaceae bacterium]